MKITSLFSVVAIALIIPGLVVTPVKGDDESSVDAVVNQIGGNELKRIGAQKANSSSGKVRSFGKFTPRGELRADPPVKQVPVPKKVSGTKKTVTFSTRGGQSDSRPRGIATATAVSDEALTTLIYHVDETSEYRVEVKFEQGTITIVSPGSADDLERLAKAINDPRLSGFTFVIEGHASAEGRKGKNKRLSQNRANKIYDLLTSGKNRVAKERLLAVGHGESEVRHAESAPEILRAEDRRVLIYRRMDQ